MRVPPLVLKLALAAVVSTATFSPASVAFAASERSIAGSWKGPFVGSNFIFEFRQAGTGWTGRYWSDRSKKWNDLQNVRVSDNVVRFSFDSTPPSSLTLKIDRVGKVLQGSANLGPLGAVPLTLSRAS
ncbi:MAG: hypothetical protein WBR13_09465 [Allosphingosinicella sp.]